MRKVKPTTCQMCKFHEQQGFRLGHLGSYVVAHEQAPVRLQMVASWLIYFQEPKSLLYLSMHDIEAGWPWFTWHTHHMPGYL